MNELMITLQTRMLHQEEEISQLSQELYVQQKEITTLKQQFSALAERFQSLTNEESIVRDMEQETRPPHY